MLQDDFFLFLMEVVVFGPGQPLRHRDAAQDMLVDNSFNHIRLDELVGGLMAIDDDIHQDILGAESHATDFLTVASLADLAGQSLPGKLFGEGLKHFLPPAETPPSPMQTLAVTEPGNLLFICLSTGCPYSYLSRMSATCLEATLPCVSLSVSKTGAQLQLPTQRTVLRV